MQPGNAISDFRYQKFRAPAEHGESLQVPPLAEAGELWKRNLEVRHSIAHAEIGEIRLVDLQVLGRLEVTSLACEYTSQYLDSSFLDSDSRVNSDQIVMGGHQPSLYHPGVWFKNFALSGLAKKFGCLAINLIVDNDVCETASIRYPKILTSVSSSRKAKNKIGEDTKVKATFGSIPIDESAPSIPYENREIVDWEFLLQFPDRVKDSIGPIVAQPLVNRFWKHLEQGANEFTSPPMLGQVLAMARHRVENEIGLGSLEVPVSKVATTQAFAKFTKAIVSDLKRFHLSYNKSLEEYRKVHKIRSRSHPVSELVEEDGWLESPFWIWHSERPQRKRLFVKARETGFQLTDRAGWKVEITEGNFVDQFLDLNDQGIAIRPKALITTMFSRLVLSDLFVHGIGGAKYDQLTDVICNRFFGVAPPGFIALSSTLKLPHKFECFSRADLANARHQERELKYHPERYLSSNSPETESLIQEKKKWTHGNKSHENSRQRHLKIVELNNQLSNIATSSLAANDSHKVTHADIRSGEVLNSREFSLVLFPESLLPVLKNTSKF